MKSVQLLAVFVVAVLLIPFAGPIASAQTEKYIEPNQAVTDNLGSQSTINTYLLVLPEPGSLQVQLEYPTTGSYRVEISQSNNGVLSVIQNTHFTTDETTVTGMYTGYANKLRVPAGLYTIKIRFDSNNGWNRKYSNADYHLTMLYKAEPTHDFEKESNGTPQTATEIMMNTQVTANLENTSDIDYFQIRAERHGSLQVQLNYPIEGSYEVEVFKVYNNTVSSMQLNTFSTDNKTTTGYFSDVGNKLRIAPGVHYIKVRYNSNNGWNKRYSSVDYGLTVLYQAEPSNDYEKQPNGEVHTAMPIHLNVPVIGNLESSSDVDYYQVTLPKDGSIQLQLEFPVSGSYYIEIFKVTDNGVLSSLQKTSFQTDQKTVSGLYTSKGNLIRNTAGDYLVKVSFNSNNGWNKRYSSSDYKLTVLSDIKTVAVPTHSGILVNGRKVSLDSYTINDNTYFKLRDLAYILNHTAKQFDVGWDATFRTILLVKGHAYTTAGGEMSISKDRKSQYVLPSNDVVYSGESKLDLLAYNIGGNNYFKLRDIAKAIDFEVTWDNAARTIGINTDRGYTEP